MSERQPSEDVLKSGLHPRSLHRGRYDFQALVSSNPDLAQWVKRSPAGAETIDFADHDAVKELNRALLLHFYGMRFWDIPKGFLCPPIPGRADYIHHAADLLAASNEGKLLMGNQVRVLDIGVGANCVFPIIGRHCYHWRFVGTDILPVSVATATHIVAFNPYLKGAIEIRQQSKQNQIFDGIWMSEDIFDLTICNPPFHGSKAEADELTARKLRNLGNSQDPELKRNFGGQASELFIDGGELAFVKRMISQSIKFGPQCLWFTTLVSKAENVKPIQAAIKAAGAQEQKLIPLKQGQKNSRIVAWTFQDPAGKLAWRKRRWMGSV